MWCMHACSMARPAACSSASRASKSTRSAARASFPDPAGSRARWAFRAAAALRRPRTWRARCVSSARFASACAAGIRYDGVINQGQVLCNGSLHLQLCVYRATLAYGQAQCSTREGAVDLRHQPACMPRVAKGCMLSREKQHNSAPARGPGGCAPVAAASC